VSTPAGASQFVSPDGRWRWDGVSWVPIPAAPAVRRPMPARWVAAIVVGSIASLLLAGTGLAVLSNWYSTAGGRIFGPGAPQNCLPADFPSYPGAAMLTSFRGFNICTTVYTTQDTSDQVLFFYDQELQTYPWRETGGSAERGTIDFARLDGSKGSGELSVAQAASPTQFTVVYQT
jgi:hypothetical protein